MKVIIDSAIPYIRGVVEPYAEVVYCKGAEIDSSVVSNADALVVRTRTECGRELLEGSKVQFIATATIGRDHIDQEYCNEAGIAVTSAAGCNARGVLQWVAAALKHIVESEGKRPEEVTLGVVGVGNVGSLVVEYAHHWGFKVLMCDPPRHEREGGAFYPIEHIVREADIITLHTPLDASTHHLINSEHLAVMKPNAVIINASRGAVVDNRAVRESGHRYVFDVWEGEPRLDRNILQHAMLATPHIAGYSQQGKANATAMSINALSHHFDLPLKEWRTEEITPTTPRLIGWEDMCATIDKYCDIVAETEMLKHAPEAFESLRNNYSYREEYF
ncbi:MAG: 4-phosphoerythronate dehydrogenase [Alistipes sp.]|nr:4-phosphoerythronate dehydrogenase [Alistipes sp.]